MILLDTALQKLETEGRPLQIAIYGSGFMVRGIVNQIHRYTPGIRLALIVNRTVQNARSMLDTVGIKEVKDVVSVKSLEDAIAAGMTGVTDDPLIALKSGAIDLIVESTGHVEYGANVITQAIDHGKPVVNMNAELDATVGPWLNELAVRAGVLVTGCDGDQPAVQMNLYRFVKQLGLTPRVCGNIKGLQDRYRNPTTQASFAKEWGQSPTMVTSFADGTKISFEQALVANATGMQVAQRGMLGFEHDGHVDDMLDWYDLDQLRELGGIVDYVVGPKPGPGVYVFAEAPNDFIQKHYLNYGKLGKGPLYSFYIPYHLTVMEVALSIARVALFQDHVVTSAGKPTVDVVSAAKVNLAVGDVIDGLGGYKTYGLCENTDVSMGMNALPLGIAEGCRVIRDVRKDVVLTYDDVALPDHRLAIKLRKEQDAHFF